MLYLFFCSRWRSSTVIRRHPQFSFQIRPTLGPPLNFFGKTRLGPIFLQSRPKRRVRAHAQEPAGFHHYEPNRSQFGTSDSCGKIYHAFFLKNQQSRSSTQRIYVYKNSSLSPIFFPLKLESTCNRPKQRGWAVEMPQIYSNLYIRMYIYTLKFQCRKQILGIPTQAFLAFKFFFLHQAVARNNLDSLTQYQASLKQVIFFTICIIISTYLRYNYQVLYIYLIIYDTTPIFQGYLIAFSNMHQN